MFQKFYQNKKILVTGSSGFKGGWLCLWLKHLGAQVIGCGLEPATTPSLFQAADLGSIIDHRYIDIRNEDAIDKLVFTASPDLIFHLAAQSLVHDSYNHPINTITTNAVGSVNILESARRLRKPIICVMITSDKVYENNEWIWGYRETDTLGGKDIYSGSKSMAEIAINSYFHSFFGHHDSKVTVAVARAGNVIGGGDWAADRIVPDCIRAYTDKNKLTLRNPSSTRPWQHVLDPISGYLLLGAELANSRRLNGEAFNFGPPQDNNFTVGKLVESMKTYWDEIPFEQGSSEKKKFHEAGLLKLNCEKAKAMLGWEPTLSFQETVKMTIDWYRGHLSDGSSTLETSIEQIEDYIDLAKRRGRSWTK